jgi:sulfite exporter TauE/SafE
VTPLLLTVLVASLAGSLHCAGMCGGFVAFYAGSDPSTGGRRALIHAAYNGARLIGYATLGIAAGSIGQALDLAGSMAGFQRLAAPVAGVTMIVWDCSPWLARGASTSSRPRRPPGLSAVS